MLNTDDLSIFLAPIKPPNDENELLKRANVLSGFNLGELACYVNFKIPVNPNINKGWAGLLLEHCLGAYAKNKAERDFSFIDVELKTIPIDNNGKSLETTFICMASLINNYNIIWETSYVRYKLARILWIPIEGKRDIPILQRRIGTPVLWSPNIEEELKLKQDWEEIMNFIDLGQIESLISNLGEVLQLRPKAANSNTYTVAIGEFGQPIFITPRGFYLKKNFTSNILAKLFWS